LNPASAIGPSRPTNALGDADAGAIDQDARRAVPPARRRNRRLRARRVRHVARHRDAADLAGDRFGRRAVEIEHRDLGASLGQGARRRRAQARRAAGDKCRMPLDAHRRLLVA
jgi:hypothetical protein